MYRGNNMNQRYLGQVNQRMFGEYRCQNCNRMWTSANSWANYTQTCKTCHIEAYPVKQVPLEKSSELDKSDPTKHHPQELCGRCKALGYFCGQKAVLRYRPESLNVRPRPTTEESDLTILQKMILFVVALIVMYLINTQPRQ